MPLEFDERQLLLNGVHDATIEEVEIHFGRFQRSDQRVELLQKLKEYVAALQRGGIQGSLVVDGSFVMQAVDEPDDLDLLLVLPEDWDLTAELRPFQYNLVSKRWVRKAFAADVIVVTQGSSEETKWVAFFGQVKPKWCTAFGWPAPTTKGLVRIWL
jgi:hypothetical protein